MFGNAKSACIGKGGEQLQTSSVFTIIPNDYYGHTVGDKAIQNVAGLLQRIFDADDLIGRYGGDKFVVFMQNVSADTVCRKIEQFRRILADEQGGDSLFCSSYKFMLLYNA